MPTSQPSVWDNDDRPVDFTPALLFELPEGDRDSKPDTPKTLFSAGITSDLLHRRPGGKLVGRYDGARLRRFFSVVENGQMLVYTDGSCLKTDSPDSPVAGCAFMFNFFPEGMNAFRLENRGPTGIFDTQTSQRAQLRAVVAAVHFFVQDDERYNELVIATDSMYVVRGATADVVDWVRTGWTASGNRDLWDFLFREIQALRDDTRGSRRVRFWLIDPKFNKQAHLAAQEAAKREPIEFFDKDIGDRAPKCTYA